jgi:hypothetical protein
VKLTFFQQAVIRVQPDLEKSAGQKKVLYDIGYHYHLKGRVIMLAAMVTACGLWGISWCLGNRLASAWGVLLPCALMPFLALIDLDMMQLRTLIVVAMLATLVMLFNSRWRHYLLLPSCMALAGGLAAISLHFSFN